ncbi:MAG: sterol desaturase family protein, partial [Ilumatobacter sp.]|nr:sterol desaturase family protein [Ilumatobacter sp.]
MKKLASRPIDSVDLLSVPFFAGTMIWESRVLAKRELREEGDLDDVAHDELGALSLPADPLVPVGYEPRDTKASLKMLGG